MPLLNLAESFLDEGDLKNCYLIGVQHILKSTITMLDSLVKKGLLPENISIIGKCYSTNLEAFNEMQRKGYDVSIDSFAFNSHKSFDETFQMSVSRFLQKRKNKLNLPSFKKIIILDDGGEVINILDNYIEHNNIVAVEQTSSGFEKIKNKAFAFPIINLARAYFKLNYEASFIASKIFDGIVCFLSKENKKMKNILLLGNGAVGKKLFLELNKYYNVTIADVKKEASDFDINYLHKYIPFFDIIIGSTGKTSINKSLHKFIKKGTVLISTSSSDREFDAVYLRKRMKNKNYICHKNLKIDDICLVNNGFPINFSGKPNSVSPKFIQLTRAMIIIAIIQGLKTKQKGIIELDIKLQNLILYDFKRIISLKENLLVV